MGAALTEQERRFTPADPLVEDDAADPEPGLDDEFETAEPEVEPARRDGRRFARIGWSLVAVCAVVGALMVVELVRISTALNRTACIQKAQADFMEALGPGVTPQFAGLDRLTGQNQLNGCGH